MKEDLGQGADGLIASYTPAAWPLLYLFPLPSPTLTSSYSLLSLSFQLKEEPPLREQGAKYSAETGRLIPASSQALSRRRNHQGQRSHSSGKDGGAQPSILQDQELLVSTILEAETAMVSASRFPGFPASTFLACLRVASPEALPPKTVRPERPCPRSPHPGL